MTILHDEEIKNKEFFILSPYICVYHINVSKIFVEIFEN